MVTQLVRRARDEIAAKTEVAAPAAIRVTMHPSVESFARATGQPWWTSGATDRSAIDLLPVTILQQRGQLERTIRHEVAHVLVDEALSKRPMWVREGAASYFASPNPTRGAGLTRRSARGRRIPATDVGRRSPRCYARAEACFRRQIADGKAWRDD